MQGEDPVEPALPVGAGASQKDTSWDPGSLGHSVNTLGRHYVTLNNATKFLPCAPYLRPECRGVSARWRRRREPWRCRSTQCPEGRAGHAGLLTWRALGLVRVCPSKLMPSPLVSQAVPFP